jgi:5-methylcytosine-specific restriction endonuclease McrA
MAKHDGRSSQAWKRMRRQILEANDVCWLCGKPGANTIDHVLPLSQFPELAHDLGNLRPAHKTCNSSKGAGTGGNTVRPMPRSRRW